MEVGVVGGVARLRDVPDSVLEGLTLAMLVSREIAENRAAGIGKVVFAVADSRLPGTANALAARADGGADAARHAAEVELAVYGAPLARAVRVDDADVAIPCGIMIERPIDGGGGKRNPRHRKGN